MDKKCFIHGIYLEWLAITEKVWEKWIKEELLLLIKFDIKVSDEELAHLAVDVTEAGEPASGKLLAVKSLKFT